MRHKVKGSDRVTFSLGETITPGDDNHLLPPQFTGRDILAFARSLPALYLRLRYDSRGDASTRCVLEACRTLPRARKVIDGIFKSTRSRRAISSAKRVQWPISPPENSEKTICRMECERAPGGGSLQSLVKPLSKFVPALLCPAHKDGKHCNCIGNSVC